MLSFDDSFGSKTIFLLTLFLTLCIAGLTEVIIYSSPDDKKKNRGFCFLEYESHKVRVPYLTTLSLSRVTMVTSFL
jgi:hypothetical protein